MLQDIPASHQVRPRMRYRTPGLQADRLAGATLLILHGQAGLRIGALEAGTGYLLFLEEYAYPALAYAARLTPALPPGWLAGLMEGHPLQLAKYQYYALHIWVQSGLFSLVPQGAWLPACAADYLLPCSRAIPQHAARPWVPVYTEHPALGLNNVFAVDAEDLAPWYALQAGTVRVRHHGDVQLALALRHMEALLHVHLLIDGPWASLLAWRGDRILLHRATPIASLAELVEVTDSTLAHLAQPGEQPIVLLSGQPTGQSLEMQTLMERFSASLCPGLRPSPGGLQDLFEPHRWWEFGG